MLTHQRSDRYMLSSGNLRISILVLLSLLSLLTIGCAGPVEVVKSVWLKQDYRIVVLPLAMNNRNWKTTVIPEQSYQASKLWGIPRHENYLKEMWALAIAWATADAIEDRDLWCDVSRDWVIKLNRKPQDALKAEQEWKDVPKSLISRWLSRYLHRGMVTRGGIGISLVDLSKSFAYDRHVFLDIAWHDTFGDCRSEAGSGKTLDSEQPRSHFSREFEMFEGQSDKQLLEFLETDYLITGEILTASNKSCKFILYCIDHDGNVVAVGAAECKVGNLTRTVRKLTNALFRAPRG